MTVVVDAHHHFWRIAEQDQAWRTAAHAAIARDYTPADLRDELAAAGVDATVLVQSVDGADENDRLRHYAAGMPSVAGVVAWLPLGEPAAARRELDRLAAVPRVVGVRCLVGRDPLDWLAGAESRALFAQLAARGLAWDVVAVTPAQVAAVRRLATDVPGLRIVVDHLARPPIETGGWEPWASGIRALSECPGIALKISVGIDVLTEWTAWEPAALERYVDHVVEQLTPQRLMLASNWPVIQLRRPYAAAWRDLEAALARCDVEGADRDAVLGDTAARWYGLAVGAPTFAEG
jgi:L-fucono-1,5-lactonase